MFTNIDQNHVKSDVGNQLQFVQWFFFPMYKSNDFGGVNDFLDLRFNIKKSLPPRNHWIYTWEKKTTVQIKLDSQDYILHGFDGYWEIFKTVYSSEPGKKNRCTQINEFRPERALGTKTMYSN